MKRISSELLGGASIAALYFMAPAVVGDVVLAFPVAAVIGAAAIIGGSLISSRGAKRAAETSAAAIRRREGTLDPDVFAGDVGILQGKFRELAAIGAIPGFQSAAATALGRLGLDDTGLGAALSTAAGGAGELDALRNALNAALSLRGLATALPVPVGFNSGAGLGQGVSAIGQGLLAASQKSTPVTTPVVAPPVATPTIPSSTPVPFNPALG